MSVHIRSRVCCRKGEVSHLLRLPLSCAKIRATNRQETTQMRTRRTIPVIGKFGDRVLKLHPNGEAVIYRQKIKELKHFVSRPGDRRKKMTWQTVRLFLMMKDDFLHTQKQGWYVASIFMGLSLVRNFDIAANPFILASASELLELKLIADACEHPLPQQVTPPVKRATRYGQNGITRSGARTVRQCAHLMQKTYGRGALTFATVTIPNIPVEQLRIVHHHWPKVVQAYRLAIKRDLQKNGLRGEVITVSEIQEKRHQKSGVPVLHLHSLWVGRLPYGGWAISTVRHDNIWRQAIRSVLPGIRVSFKSAANLQSVKTSASNYLGKYMSKGATCVASLKENGFSEWLPRQWWNVSRSLLQWVKSETVVVGTDGEFLLSPANLADKGMWEFVGHVLIDIGEKQQYWLATYGRLSQQMAAAVRNINGYLPTRDAMSAYLTP